MIPHSASSRTRESFKQSRALSQAGRIRTTQILTEIYKTEQVKRKAERPKTAAEVAHGMITDGKSIEEIKQYFSDNGIEYRFDLEDLYKRTKEKMEKATKFSWT